MANAKPNPKAWQASSNLWRAAKALHLSSLNSRSTCSLARSFLARAITDGKAESTIQQEYDKYLNKCTPTKQRRRRKKRSTTATKTTRSISRRETNDVENLMLVKKFMNDHGLDITKMHKIIATMRYLELLGTQNSKRRSIPERSKSWVGHTKSDSFLISKTVNGRPVRFPRDDVYRVTTTTGDSRTLVAKRQRKLTKS